MRSITTRLLLFLVMILFATGVGEGIWIYQQQKQIALLEQTEFRDVHGNIEETLHEIDRFTETQDRSVLENLYVRVTFLEREAQNMAELTGAKPIEYKSTTPSGLIDLILRNQINNDQATDYLKQVRQKLNGYQKAVAPVADVDTNQKGLIQLWRDLSTVADHEHKQWKLP